MRIAKNVVFLRIGCTFEKMAKQKQFSIFPGLVALNDHTKVKIYYSGFCEFGKLFIVLAHLLMEKDSEIADLLQ